MAEAVLALLVAIIAVVIHELTLSQSQPAAATAARRPRRVRITSSGDGSRGLICRKVPIAVGHVALGVPASFSSA